MLLTATCLESYNPVHCNVIIDRSIHDIRVVRVMKYNSTKLKAEAENCVCGWRNIRVCAFTLYESREAKLTELYTYTSLLTVHFTVTQYTAKMEPLLKSKLLMRFCMIAVAKALVRNLFCA